jgi:hypothetical protein
MQQAEEDGVGPSSVTEMKARVRQTARRGITDVAAAFCDHVGCQGPQSMKRSTTTHQRADAESAEVA